MPTIEELQQSLDEAWEVINGLLLRVERLEPKKTVAPENPLSEPILEFFAKHPIGYYSPGTIVSDLGMKKGMSVPISQVCRSLVKAKKLRSQKNPQTERDVFGLVGQTS